MNLNFASITDGLSNTIAVAEFKEAVIWTKPDEAKTDKPWDLLGSDHPGGLNVLLLDGSVRFLKTTIAQGHPQGPGHPQRRRDRAGRRLQLRGEISPQENAETMREFFFNLSFFSAFSCGEISSPHPHEDSQVGESAPGPDHQAEDLILFR